MRGSRQSPRRGGEAEGGGCILQGRDSTAPICRHPSGCAAGTLRAAGARAALGLGRAQGAGGRLRRGRRASCLEPAPVRGIGASGRGRGGRCTGLPEYVGHARHLPACEGLSCTPGAMRGPAHRCGCGGGDRRGGGEGLGQPRHSYRCCRHHSHGGWQDLRGWQHRRWGWRRSWRKGQRRLGRCRRSCCCSWCSCCSCCCWRLCWCSC
mmetsp:Transcript_152478/g.489033  ORF Transcript_152478/g.489033 Transcript_152478/m.489033 type:complete len:208 (-) Transcript_152478:361-984(-)